MAPEAPQFHLSNDTAQQPPIIHSIYVTSTNTWQYVVADPSTRRCVVIDPVRDTHRDSAVLATEAADTIATLVKDQGYHVDLIVETHSLPSPPQTGAWLLRMQFASWQGTPPHLCSDGTVSAMEKLWQRKYGSTRKFVTTLGKGLDDNQSMMVGRMRVTCMHVAGFGTPDRRAFLIGNCLFGAYSIALLSQTSWRQSWTPNASAETQPSIAPVDKQTAISVWSSMQRVLSLHESIRVYPESDAQSPRDSEPYRDVAFCRANNPYIGLNPDDLLLRWEGEKQVWREGQLSQTGQRGQPRASGGGKKQRSRPVTPATRNPHHSLVSVELESLEVERRPREAV